MGMSAPSSNYPPSTSVTNASGSANPPSTASTPSSSNMPSYARFGVKPNQFGDDPQPGGNAFAARQQQVGRDRLSQQTNSNGQFRLDDSNPNNFGVARQQPGPSNQYGFSNNQNGYGYQQTPQYSQPGNFSQSGANQPKKSFGYADSTRTSLEAPLPSSPAWTKFGQLKFSRKGVQTGQTGTVKNRHGDEFVRTSK